MGNFFDNNDFDAVNNTIDTNNKSNNVEIDQIGNELNNIVMSYVDDDNNIVKPSNDVIAPQTEESPKLFDNDFNNSPVSVAEPVVEDVVAAPVESKFNDIDSNFSTNNDENINNEFKFDTNIFNDYGFNKSTVPTEPEVSAEPVSEQPVIDNNEFKFDNIIDDEPINKIEKFDFVEPETPTNIVEEQPTKDEFSNFSIDESGTIAPTSDTIKPVIAVEVNYNDEKAKEFEEGLDLFKEGVSEYNEALNLYRSYGIDNAKSLTDIFESSQIVSEIYDKTILSGEELINSLNGNAPEKDTELSNIQL